MKIIHLLPLVLALEIMIPGLALAQPSNTELQLLRENRKLQAEADSLRLLVEYLTGLDDIWAQLSEIEDDGESWGSGISSLEELSLPEAERLIALRLRRVFPEMGISYAATIRDKVVGYCRPRNAAMLGGSFRRLNERMPYFREVFSRYGVPPELIPLCIVESAVSRRALSPAGAAGMWQLMPDTARRYGLRVGGGEDERYSVEKSTEAAARLLRNLKDDLGSWSLAVMAYNCGAARVRKAVMASGTTDAWVVWKRVPKETQAYLPALLAVGYLMEYGTEYGIKM